MAFQGTFPKAGASADPTKKIGRPAGESYKAPKLYRGNVVLERKDAGPNSGYGQNQAAQPSSVGVEQSATLTDFDISPPDGDAARAALVARGTGPQDNELNSQTRDLPPGNVPDHPFMKGAAPGPKVPTVTGANPGQPVGQPGK
jgi:hypothetical protein